MTYIERELEKEIKKYLNSKEMLAVVGARQCGKTTLINKILNDAVKGGKKVKRVSFDNVKDVKTFETDIDSFVEQNVKGFDILFIDEVHYSKNSGKKLKYIYDTFGTKIIISGSSAPEMSIQSLKYLAGRIFLFNLYPFSFKEFLRSKDERLVKIFSEGRYKEEVLRTLNDYLREFILYGGYPRVVIEKDVEEKKKILESLYSIYLLKEVKEILGLSEDYRLTDLLKSLSLQTGSIINYNELSSTTGFSFHEVKKYLNVLEKTFICSLVRPFYTNRKTELVKNPKVYFYDTGFRNTCIGNFSVERSDLGSLYENFIFSELVKKKIFAKYWNTKSKAEVDFIITSNSENIPVEVKSKIWNDNLGKSFISFINKYNPNRAYYLSLDYEKEVKLKKCKINFVPFVKFIETNSIFS